MRTSGLFGIAGVLASLSASVQADTSSSTDLASAVEAVRQATVRFQDVDVALAEGYVPDPTNHCATAADAGLPPELGAMGIHYLRPDLLGLTASEPRVDGVGTHTDFENPSTLIYEPQADGSLVLVGVESLVFRKAWEEAGNASPPTFVGRTWELMEDNPATEIDEAHGFMPHYDQHVYFRDNGVPAVEPFNALVSCEHHQAHGH